jgi:hypothetical protein
MEEDLDSALSSLLGGEILPKEIALPARPETVTIYNLGGLALEHYNRAKEYLRQGRWAEYGKEIEELEKVLKEMSTLEKGKKE